MIQVGDIVKWTSQSNGSWKEKQGRVVAIVPGESRIEPFFRQAVGEVPKSRIKWSDSVSKKDRAIVEVKRSSGQVCDYYAPRLSILEKREGDGE